MSTPFDLEFESDAWRGIGALPYERFMAVRHAMLTLAKQLAERNLPMSAPIDLTDSVKVAPSLTIGDLVVFYTVDHDRRRIVLHRLGRLQETPASNEQAS